MLKHLHNTFIPHEGNDHKPHALRPRALKWYAGVMVGIKVVTTMLLFVMYPDFAHLSSDIRNDSLVYLNEARTNAGLQELQINPELDRAAQSKALDILERGYFAHQDPDGNMPWDLINTEAYNYYSVGENLAIDFTTGKIAHQALMRSEGHRNNILGDTFTDIGIGVVSGTFNGRNTNILVQLYGSETVPRKTPVLIPVARAAETETTPAKPVPTPPPVQETPVVPTPPAQQPVQAEVTPKPIQETPAAPIKVVYKNETAGSTALNATIERTQTETPAEPTPVPVATPGSIEHVAEKKTASKLDTVVALTLWSKRIFYAFLVYLGLTLLLNIVIKIRIQHLPTIGGAALVLLIVGALSLLHAHSLEQVGRIVRIF